MTNIQIHNADKSADLPVGTSLGRISNMLDTALPCRAGSCGSCVFRVLYGQELLNKPDEREQRRLESLHAPDDARLLCRTRVTSEGTVTVAKHDRYAHTLNRQTPDSQAGLFEGLNGPATDRASNSRTA